MAIHIHRVSHTVQELEDSDILAELALRVFREEPEAERIIIEEAPKKHPISNATTARASIICRPVGEDGP